MEGNEQRDREVSLRKITQARIFLMGENPFFGQLVILLELLEDSNIPTMGTDGEILRYNPKWVANLTEPEMHGLLVHEVLHCALGHIWRRQERDHHRWNYACDYAVNLILKDNNFTMPKGGLIDEKFRKDIAEQIYDKIKVIETEVHAGGCGKDGKGDCDICKGHGHWGEVGKDPVKQKDLERKWGAALENAAKQRGTAPAGMERVIDNLQTKEDWRKILADYLSTSSTDFDFMRRDRRFLDDDFYLPDLYSEETLENLVVAIDTSGSISEQTIAHFISDVRGIVKSFPKTKGWVIDCDAEVGKVQDIQEAVVNGKYYGGGGTSHIPVVKEIEKRNLNPKVALFFTDLYTEFPKKAPDYPVLWLVPKEDAHMKAPFGRVIVLHEPQ